MSHLHLVDGVLEPVWWVLGYAITLGILGIAVTKVRKVELAKKVPFIGVISALMLITMSIPLGFLPVHLNLTVLAGILAGPWLGFIGVFIVNLILALIGHGGITAVGLNTLIIGVEVFAGSFVYKLLVNRIKPVKASIISVVIALLLSTSLMLGMLAAVNANWEHALSHGDGHTSILHEGEPLEIGFFALSGWSAFVVILLSGIMLEALVTALVVRFFMKVRPEMVI
ncbi:MAG: energy-coupling factor ABC transporter permease [Clostridiaceae bacterium]|nr:energy-coupling factor ABC transporter permease [Clostridiaceae bacterium]